jgi:hypothetical protein
MPKKKKPSRATPERYVETVAVNLADGIFVMIHQVPSGRCLVISIDEAMRMRGDLVKAINRATELQREADRKRP